MFLEGTENQEAEDGPSEEPARGRLHVPGGRPSQASLVATWSGLGFGSRGWGGLRGSGDGSRVGDVLEAEAGRRTQTCSSVRASPRRTPEDQGQEVRGRPVAGRSREGVHPGGVLETAVRARGALLCTGPEHMRVAG